MSNEIRGNIPIRHVRLGGRCSHFVSKGALLNSYDTHDWIISRRNLVGWTYSFDPTYFRHFKRLIVGQPCSSLLKTVKQASNIHQKVYISKNQMLISTANLVAPTIQNVSIIVRDQVLINHMKITFNVHWKLL